MKMGACFLFLLCVAAPLVSPTGAQTATITITSSVVTIPNPTANNTSATTATDTVPATTATTTAPPATAPPATTTASTTLGISTNIAGTTTTATAPPATTASTTLGISTNIAGTTTTATAPPATTASTTPGTSTNTTGTSTPVSMTTAKTETSEMTTEPLQTTSVSFNTTVSLTTVETEPVSFNTTTVSVTSEEPKTTATTTEPLNTTTIFFNTTTVLVTSEETETTVTTTEPLNTTTIFFNTTTVLVTSEGPQTTATTTEPLNTTVFFNTTTVLVTSEEPKTTVTTTEPPNTTTVSFNTTTASTTTTEPLETTTVFITTTQPQTSATTTTAAPETPTTLITTTIITAAPTTSLVCSPGGTEQDGVCICSDEWTGTTCSEPNFCESETLFGYLFPSTLIGWFSYSNATCAEGTTSAGKPLALTRCSKKSGKPKFDPPKNFTCDQTLSDIQKNITSATDLEALASSTQILTSQPESLTAENVTKAAQIVNTLLLSPNTTQDVRESAVATVSQLLNASVTDDTEEQDDATLNLTLTLDKLAVDLSSNFNASQVVQPNLVVQSAQIPVTETRGVQFTSLTGSSESFIADRIKLDTNATSVVMENNITDVLIYIQFPTDANTRQPLSNVSLGFVLYQNDRFFQSRRYRRHSTTVRVLSASVGSGQERSMVPQHVEMMFRPTLMEGTSLFDFACVFWNYDVQDWSTTGCVKGNASDGVLRCFCNHTTNFAALWSFRQNVMYPEVLGAMSIVGLSFSILGLVITIIHHIKDQFQRSSRQKNKNSSIALLSIYVSLLAFIITFLSGIEHSGRNLETPSEANMIPTRDEHVDRDRGLCTVVAALLHFFLLATFMWNSVYGTQLVLLVRSMRRSLPSYWTWLSMVVGWGAPAVVVAVTLGATYRVDNPLGYRQEKFCWLAAVNKDDNIDPRKPMLWSFVLPIGVILIYNVILLVLTSVTMCRTDPRLTSTGQRSLSKKFLSSFSLAVLLGLSWSLGYIVLVTTEQTHLIFSILFCLCTTTQGFQIFILFTARTPSFRATITRSMQAVSSVNIPLRNSSYSLWKKWKTTTSETYKDLRDSQTSTSKML